MSTFIISTDQDNLKGIEVASRPTHIFSVLLLGENIGVRVLAFVVFFGMSKFESGRQDYTCRSLACIYTEMDDFTVLKRHEKNYCTKSPPYIHDRGHIIP